MNRRSFNVLELDRVLEAAASLCQTPLGQERTLALGPLTEKEQVELELDRVAETVQFVEIEGGLDLSGLHDLSLFEEHLTTQGTFLSPEELDLFGQTLDCLARNRKRIAAKAQEYPLLAGLGQGLADHREIIRDFKRIFGPGLTIADSASPALGRIRERTAGLKNDIRRELETMLTDPRAGEIVQEAIVTQRNDRFVVPVKAGLQNRMEGIIHDASASRRTVFVEPLSIVSKNNQLGLMAAEEREEVIRILTNLTDRLREVWPELKYQIQTGAELDCLQARARLARRLKAVRPEIDPVRLELKGARHPLLLLGGGRVIPVDLRFPEGKSILIISGPNAGGKTVSLKTLGLLHLMALSGLLVPAEEGSRVTFCTRVAALIGDDQAISDGASTFSAKLKWFKEILDSSGPGSLVLIDELGGGTDPAEGAALGLAVLDSLAEKGVRVLATTHLSFIKAYAAGNPAAENLAVQFDPDTRRPTYELSYGQPGLSNAFEAAATVGLDPAVTARAKGYLSGDEEKFKGLLEELNRPDKQTQRGTRPSNRQGERTGPGPETGGKPEKRAGAGPGEAHLPGRGPDQGDHQQGRGKAGQNPGQGQVSGGQGAGAGPLRVLRDQGRAQAFPGRGGKFRLGAEAPAPAPGLGPGGPGGRVQPPRGDHRGDQEGQAGGGQAGRRGQGPGGPGPAQPHGRAGPQAGTDLETLFRLLRDQARPGQHLARGEHHRAQGGGGPAQGGQGPGRGGSLRAGPALGDPRGGHRGPAPGGQGVSGGPSPGQELLLPGRAPGSGTDRN